MDEPPVPTWAVTPGLRVRVSGLGFRIRTQSLGFTGREKGDLRLYLDRVEMDG